MDVNDKYSDNVLYVDTVTTKEHFCIINRFKFIISYS